VATAAALVVVLLSPGAGRALGFLPASLVVTNEGQPEAALVALQATVTLGALSGGGFRLFAHGEVGNDLTGDPTSLDYVENLEIAFQSIDGLPFAGVTLLAAGGASADLRLVDAANLLLSVDLGAFVDVYRASLPPGEASTFAGLAAAMPPTIEWSASWDVAVDPAGLGERFHWLFGSYGVTSCADFGEGGFECDGGSLELPAALRVPVELAPAIPEPGGLLLMLAGLATVGARLRRSAG